MKLFILVLITSVFGTCNQRSGNVNESELETMTDFAKISRVLDSIHVEDQKYRNALDSIGNKYGWDSEEIRNHWQVISKIDSSNLVVVEEILNSHGWLSAEQVGRTANSTLFLVIQHSNQVVQEKYLPIMRKAVEEGKANSRSLALLEDRVRLGRGELQIYGSQIGTDQETGQMYVLPLTEPEQVNERRLRVGLGPIEDYISHWNLEWDVEEYKNNLPRWIEKLKSER